MLITMQAFHTRLFAPHGLDADLAALARLTHASLTHMTALDNELTWVAW